MKQSIFNTDLDSNDLTFGCDAFEEYSDGPDKVDACLANETSSHNGHEYVDLGLPSGLLWATCNVGANSPEEHGDYFAWGETNPKGKYEYTGDNYKFVKEEHYSKYNEIDGKTELDIVDDVACIKWGGNWHIPTKEEFNELRENCDWIMDFPKGVIGKSKTNGNSIFLPAAGECSLGGCYSVGSTVCCWTRSLKEDDWAWSFVICYFPHRYDFRGNGLSIRPVFNK